MSYYTDNLEKCRANARERANRHNAFNRKLRALILSAQPCMDCGEPPDPDTPFEFDHREGIGANSQRRMSDMISKGSHPKRFMQELPKCDVVCPTCHKARTYDRAQWKRVG
jgi:hypothetical protein